MHVSVSPTVLAGAAIPVAELPAIGQEQLSLEAIAIAPGWWVIIAGVVLIIVLIVRQTRRLRKK